jgi:hypothetical protein
MITALVSDGRLAANAAVVEFLGNLGGLSEAARLSEQDYVSLALAFASVRLPDDSASAHRLYLHLMAGLRIEEPLPDFPVDESAVAALHEAQRGFVDWLDRIREDPQRAIPQLASPLFDAGRRVVMRPTYLAGAGTVEISYQCLPADFGAALGFVLTLLVDRSRPFMGNVGRCKYSECGRYFLVIKDDSRIGRPRRDYCSKAHFSMARAATAAVRIKAYRQKKREQSKRASRRKPK